MKTKWFGQLKVLSDGDEESSVFRLIHCQRPFAVIEVMQDDNYLVEDEKEEHLDAHYHPQMLLSGEEEIDYLVSGYKLFALNHDSSECDYDIGENIDDALDSHKDQAETTPYETEECILDRPFGLPTGNNQEDSSKWSVEVNRDDFWDVRYEASDCVYAIHKGNPGACILRLHPEDSYRGFDFRKFTDPTYHHQHHKSGVDVHVLHYPRYETLPNGSYDVVPLDIDSLVNEAIEIASAYDRLELFSLRGPLQIRDNDKIYIPEGSWFQVLQD